ncbi:MAG TPA: gluconate 2-dehydrogenase subunit 3 family protein [Steroidobacteraceae bacterium]
MALHRRQFLADAGLGLFVFHISGVATLLTPRAARAQHVPLRLLSVDEAAQIDNLGEIFVPGAATAGLSHYLDHQLSVASSDSLLMIRYLDVPPPYAEFYKPCIASIKSAAHALHQKTLDSFTSPERDEFVMAMQKGALPGWQGPPASLFYFVLRADAIDVVYGTTEGFAKLGIPYMAHITPPTPW